MRVALIGATGLVGSRLVPHMTGHDLLVLGRRPIGFAGREQVGEAAQWPAMLAGEALDAAVSAIGSTWRKAGSWEAFEQVDRHAVVDFARAALASGARRMITVSSVGADPASASEYLAIKGRCDEQLAGLGFDRLDVLRPGLLRGPRGSDRRVKERIAIAISPLANLLLRGSKAKWAAIDAEQVARAVAALLHCTEPGRFIHHNPEIHALARSLEGGRPA